MLKSMTAYAHVCVISPHGRFVVELQSVNRKHLEINTFLPKELLRYDADIKKWIGMAVGRGQINVRIAVTFEGEGPLVVMPNLALARQIKSAWSSIAADLGLKNHEEGLVSLLSSNEDLLIYDENVQDEECYRIVLRDLIAEALQQFTEMKIYEGRSLCEDIEKRFAKIATLIKEIDEKTVGATNKYQQRLTDKLKELVEATPDLEERILREVCIYAERIDIAEELTRFNSHLQQVEKLLHPKEPTVNQSIGKPLEFLIQELNREVNTIGSKFSDLDVTRYVIDIKSELERIREQIQNIE